MISTYKSVKVWSALLRLIIYEFFAPAQAIWDLASEIFTAKEHETTWQKYTVKRTAHFVLIVPSYTNIASYIVLLNELHKGPQRSCCLVLNRTRYFSMRTELFVSVWEASYGSTSHYFSRQESSSSVWILRRDLLTTCEVGDFDIGGFVFSNRRIEGSLLPWAKIWFNTSLPAMLSHCSRTYRSHGQWIKKSQN